MASAKDQQPHDWDATPHPRVSRFDDAFYGKLVAPTPQSVSSADAEGRGYDLEHVRLGGQDRAAKPFPPLTPPAAKTGNDRTNHRVATGCLVVGILLLAMIVAQFVRVAFDWSL